MINSIAVGDVLRGELSGETYVVTAVDMRSGKPSIRYDSWSRKGLIDRGTLWGVEGWHVTLIGRNYRKV